MTSATARDCLGGPTRGTVLERLRWGPLSAGQIGLGMPVSRPAVSQHLAVLKEAGLVIDRPVGTRRVYTIDPRGPSALPAWFDQFWDQALASLQDGVQRSIESEKAEKEKKRWPPRAPSRPCGRTSSS